MTMYNLLYEAAMVKGCFQTEFFCNIPIVFPCQKHLSGNKRQLSEILLCSNVHTIPPN